MSEVFYPVVVRRLSEEDGGGFLALVPDLQGCMSDGDTPQEACTNVQQAVAEWIAEANRRGRVVPKPFSAADRARQARSEVDELVRKQDELIRSQESMLDRQEKVLGLLRQEVQTLQAMVATSPEDVTFTWNCVIPTLIPAGVLLKAKDLSH